VLSWHPTRALTEAERTAMRSGASIHILDYAPATSGAYGDIRPAAHARNDYRCDWDAHETRKFFGVPGGGVQDKAITRASSHRRPRPRAPRKADTAIIRIRKILMDATLALRERGTPPPGTASASFLIRPASVLLPKDGAWVEGARAQLVARPPTAA